MNCIAPCETPNNPGTKPCKYRILSLTYEPRIRSHFISNTIIIRKFN